MTGDCLLFGKVSLRWKWNLKHWSEKEKQMTKQFTMKKVKDDDEENENESNKIKDREKKRSQSNVTKVKIKANQSIR